MERLNIFFILYINAATNLPDDLCKTLGVLRPSLA